MSDTPHLRRHGNATQLVVDGSPFVVLGGQVDNSSSSSLEYMEYVWERVCELDSSAAITRTSSTWHSTRVGIATARGCT